MSDDQPTVQDIKANRVEGVRWDDRYGSPQTTDGDLLVFAIESWARSGDRLSDLLYDRVRMAKEIQLHMWTSLLERVVRLAGGRMTGGVDIFTRRAGDVDAR